MEARRNERVAETVREELEEIINYELTDPRIGDVAVTEVLLSPDGRRARARLAISGGTEEQRTSLEALRGARKHIRRLLADRIDLFRLPDVELEADIDVESSPRLHSLLRKVRKGRPRDENPAEETPGSQKSPLK